MAKADLVEHSAEFKKRTAKVTDDVYSVVGYGPADAILLARDAGAKSGFAVRSGHTPRRHRFEGTHVKATWYSLSFWNVPGWKDEVFLPQRS